MARRSAAVLRQGDVLLVPCSNPPQTVWKRQRRDAGRIILARGERTGHAHAIRSEGATLLRSSEQTDALLRVSRTARLEHEDHEDLDIPPGNYLVRLQRAYLRAVDGVD